LTSYKTIEKAVVAEFKDRGSKFIAYAFPVNTSEDFNARLQEVKKEHPKASHYCFAYRLGMDGNSFRINDDGEPSGSAGRPIMGQIDSQQLTNVLIVVVRYFGGTLLGVPGLINAYKTVTSLALQAACLVQKSVELTYRLQFDYIRMNEVMRIVKKYDCTVLNREIHSNCTMTINIPLTSFKDCSQKFEAINGLELRKISGN
jgi:uncharacterized YigZ family protein